MRSKLYFVWLVCLALFLSACGMNGTSSSGSSGGGGNQGTLPNGSNVVISASSFVLDASESTAAGTLCRL